MSQAVSQGRVGSRELTEWGRKQFRLDALEREVHLFISRETVKAEALLEAKRGALGALLRSQNIDESQVRHTLENPLQRMDELYNALDERAAQSDVPEEQRRAMKDQVQQMLGELAHLHSRHECLTQEPLETMLHAKISLATVLDISDSVSQGMEYVGTSVLSGEDLKAIQAAVQRSEADGSALKEFLVCNETWVAGMKQLHSKEFEALDRRFDDDGFHDLDLPPGGDEHVTEQLAYNLAAEDYTRRKQAAESALMLRCAGLGSGTLAKLIAEDR
jgi:hypothetical protein